MLTGLRESGVTVTVVGALRRSHSRCLKASQPATTVKVMTRAAIQKKPCGLSASAAARQRVPVPRRVAIAGFNDLNGSDLVIPSLTTVRTPRAQIGEAAVAMLLQLIGGDPVPKPSLDLGFTVVVREST